VWSDDGATYVLMDDGGVDAPVPGGLWGQSLARVSGTPPKLTFKPVGNPWAPAPRTWSQIGGNRDRDDGPLGPYYSIGFTELDGVFYATQQRNWNWSANATFTGLAGVAYSSDHGQRWHLPTSRFRRRWETSRSWSPAAGEAARTTTGTSTPSGPSASSTPRG